MKQVLIDGLLLLLFLIHAVQLVFKAWESVQHLLQRLPELEGVLLHLLNLLSGWDAAGRHCLGVLWVFRFIEIWAILRAHWLIIRNFILWIHLEPLELLFELLLIDALVNFLIFLITFLMKRKYYIALIIVAMCISLKMVFMKHIGLILDVLNIFRSLNACSLIFLKQLSEVLKVNVVLGFLLHHLRGGILRLLLLLLLGFILAITIFEWHILEYVMKILLFELEFLATL